MQLNNQTLLLLFFILLAENFLPCLISGKKQDSKMLQGLLWLLDLAQQPQAGPCFVPIPRTWHSPWKMPWKWICPGNSPSRGASPSSWPPPGSFGAGHEGEICFNPKASPSEERESELELYSSPRSGDESQSWGNAAQRRNRFSTSPGRDFSSPCTGEVAVPKLMDTQQNHQQNKKKSWQFSLPPLG